MSTKIRVLSDLHLEFSTHRVEPLDTDSETILVLAGDVAPVKYTDIYVPFLDDVCSRFKYVIWLFGNHEYYRSYIDKGLEIAKTHCNVLHHNNLFIAEKDGIVIGNVHFVCATLWTDLNKKDPLTMVKAYQAMNDYRMIKSHAVKSRKIQPREFIAKHHEHVEFIRDECSDSTLDRVVVTHHAPSAMSTHPRYRGDSLNGAYFSQLDDLVEQSNAKLWIHGHTHNAFDYMIGDTRVVCNPRGYQPTEGPTGFDPYFLVEI